MMFCVGQLATFEKQFRRIEMCELLSAYHRSLFGQYSPQQRERLVHAAQASKGNSAVVAQGLGQHRAVDAFSNGDGRFE